MITDLPEGTPRTVAPGWYRLAFVIAFLGLGFQLAATDWGAYRGIFSGRPPVIPSGTWVWVKDLIGLASVLPLGILAWRLGAQSEAARRLDLVLWKGIASAWRLAWSGRDATSLAAEYARPPQDDVRAATLRGVIWALLPVGFFGGLLPDLRTVNGFIFLGGAGVLFGVNGYCRRRAAAYLREVPGLFDPFREWKLLSLDRYEPAGHGFVRAQRWCMLLLPIWWVGVGPLLTF